MTKFVVVIFPDEAKAYEGTRALKALHAEASVTVYGMAVFSKDSNGRIQVRQAADQGPLGFGVGALLGGLIGLMGGPAGATIGLGSGAMIGGLRDVYNAGVGADFVRSVSDKLTPGKTALVAELTEEWVTPLDTRMEEIGGTVIREWRSDFEDDQIEKEAEARRKELAQLQAEFAQASEERKAKLQSKLSDAQAKVNLMTERVQARMKHYEQETQAKIKELQTQAKDAKADAKAKLEKEINDLQADYKRRSGKLKQAWDLTKQAFAA